MKKRKLLLTIAALLCSAATWADVTLDITSTRLANANLSSLTGWTLDDSFNSNAEENDYTDYKTDGDANVIEFYSEWAASPGAMGTTKDFKIAQTITLTAGTYRLSAYGFYREKNGDGTNTKAFLKAGSNTQYIHGLSADGVGSYTGSSDLYKAANAFSLGDFYNTIEFTIDSKQSLEIGIVGTFNTQCSWCIVGPMTLIKVLEVGTEVTDVILNAEVASTDGWIGAVTNLDQQYTGAPDNTYLDACKWWEDCTYDMKQDIPNLPQGCYELKVATRAREDFPTSYIYVAQSDSHIKEVDVNKNGSEGGTLGNGWSWTDFRFIKSNDSNLTIGFYSECGGDGRWSGADDFHLYYLGEVPTDADKSSFSSALSTANGYTLGFEAGEYAPYTNVAAITALIAANEIDTDLASKEELASATSAIGADKWRTNDSEVNAIYDGTFSNAPVADARAGVNGWSAAEGLRQLVESNVANSIVSKGMYMWGSNVVTYGETTGYTLPLKANTVYVLTYERASWEGSSSSHTGITVTDPNGTELGTATEDGYAGNWNSTDGTLLSRSIYFATTTAGNYLFSVSPWGNTVYANMTLYKASDGLVFADGSVPTYVPGTYSSVKISRTLTANRWATAIYPFAVSGVDNIAVLNSYDASTGALGFTSASESTANEPFLMRSTAGTTEISLSNVEVSAATATDATVSKASLKGVYATKEIDNSAKNYVLSNNKIYSVGANSATINPYRAYIQIAESAPVKALNFFVDGDDDATGISTIDNGQLTIDNEIYNLAGQRMSKMQKGINIVNGKKVLF
ncbi:MAG: DUF5013 domain-containing protein [Bacteroidaceae bacterium]|nr:DUF5013 domain-containing protein [Bacteroidaceae bacterium]